MSASESAARSPTTKRRMRLPRRAESPSRRRDGCGARRDWNQQPPRALRLRRLLHLGDAEEARIEGARLLLASRRHGELDMLKRDGSRLAVVASRLAPRPSGDSRFTCPILRPGRACALAVKMQARAGLRGELRPVLRLRADQVRHHHVGVARRRPERPAGDRADVVLELRDGAGVLRPMAGIVDARRDLVDEEASRSAPSPTTKSSTPSAPTWSSAVHDPRGDRGPPPPPSPR